MSARTARDQRIKVIGAIRQAKASISVAADACSPLQGWSGLHSRIWKQYDLLGALLTLVESHQPPTGIDEP